MYKTIVFAGMAVCFSVAAALDAHPIMKNAPRARIQHVTPGQIQHAVLEHVRSSKSTAISDVQVTLLEPTEPVSLPGGMLNVRVAARQPEDHYGRQEFDISLAVGGKVVHTVRATADVMPLVDVVVTTRLIKIDDTIQPDDVAVSRIPAGETPMQYATDLDQVIGKRAARPLASHAPIYTSALAQPYLVRKGDRVTIEAKRKGLLIQTIGITKAVGQVGQMVTVTNQDSGKDLRAKVIGPGLVRVEF